MLAALHMRNLLVRRGEFTLQLPVIALIAGQTIQILERLDDDDLPDRQRAWKILDCVMHIGDEVVRQLAHIVKPEIRDAGLPKGSENSSGERDQDQGRGGERELVPP